MTIMLAKQDFKREDIWQDLVEAYRKDKGDTNAVEPDMIAVSVDSKESLE